MSESSFLWHDFETFGTDPRRDRPAQFAALRTDEALNPIDEPQVVYCSPADDVLPQPMACLITGITPQIARIEGLAENEFAARIHEQMARPGTCKVGYNNFRFDDEVCRHLFWRTFFEPYSHEYANGNSRFDLIDVLRLTRALRPDGLAWADREDGTPSFRLEDLAAANGLDTSRAHDALADVEATLGMARALRQAQPKLWDWALGLREKQVVNDLLRPGQPLLHASSRFPASSCATAPVLPLGPHPRFNNQWIIWNLNVDPGPFFDLDADTLAECLWTPGDALPEELSRLPVKQIRANRCPMLAPMAVLDPAARDRLGIDPAQLDRHRARLEDQPDFVARILALFTPADDPTGQAADAETDLYGGFSPRSDQQIYPRVRAAGADELARMGAPFRDERLNTLLFRYRARHYPDSLDTAERERWARHRYQRLVSDPELGSIQWPAYQQQLETLMPRHPDRAELFADLARWPGEIGLPELAETNNQ